MISNNYLVLAGKGMNWVSASDGWILPQAVVGSALHGQPLYVCSGTYKDGIHPGKIIGNACHFGYGGHEVKRTNYEVLINIYLYVKRSDSWHH